MQRKALIAALRAHTGPVFVAVNSAHDQFFIQAVKGDLIAQISGSFADDGDETGFQLQDGNFGIDDFAEF